MSKIIHKEKLAITTASGTISGNTSARIQGLLRSISVKPTTASTTFDIKLVDDQSVTLWERLSETGSFSEQVALPFRGVYTLTISNATNDEAFTIMLGIEE